MAFILSFIYYFKKPRLLVKRTLKTRGVEAIKLRRRDREIELLKAETWPFLIVTFIIRLITRRYNTYML
jgi:hypothetical protein